MIKRDHGIIMDDDEIEVVYALSQAVNPKPDERAPVLAVSWTAARTVFWCGVFWGIVAAIVRICR